MKESDSTAVAVRWTKETIIAVLQEFAAEVNEMCSAPGS
jgi:hypothetical protein